jgi:putative exporter of polyketide antibiotics
MIEVRLLSVWDDLMASVALVAIIVLAFCVMVNVAKEGNVLRRFGVIMGAMILLVMLPAIITGLWSAMSFGQRLGITALGVEIVILFGRSQQRPTGVRRR